MVEQEAVNFEVAGSSPAAGANFEFQDMMLMHRTVATSYTRGGFPLFQGSKVEFSEVCFLAPV